MFRPRIRRSTATFRDRELDRQFDREGFVVLPLASDDQVDRLQHFVEAMLPEDAPTFFSPHRGDTEVLRKALHHGILEEVGATALEHLADQRIFWASALVKYPGSDGELGLHQDWNFIDERYGVSGLMWLALVDTDRRNGGLHVIPGSHRWGSLRRGSHPWPNSMDDSREALLTQAVPVSVPRGHCLVYNHRLVHGSAPNLTDQLRTAVAIGFVPAQADLVHLTKDDHDRYLQFHVADDFFIHQQIGDIPAGPRVLGDPIEVDPGPLTIPARRPARSNRRWREAPTRRSPISMGPDQHGRTAPDRIFTADSDEVRFWRDGYIIMEFLDAEGVGELTRRFGELQPDDGFVPDPELPSQYHCTFLDSSRPYRAAVDRLTHDLIDPRLGSILPGYEVLTSNLYVKPPGRGRFEVHLNWITVADPLLTTLTIWIPLAATSEEAGTIQVVPGSHKLYPDVATAAAPQYFARFHQELINSHLIPLELELGEAVIFDDSLIHWSSENLASEPRVALQVEVVPKGSTTAVWIPDPSDDRWFLLYSMDRTFWLTQDKEVFYGAPDLPCIGRVPNTNREVSYQDFCDQLRHAREVRARSHALSGTSGRPRETPDASPND